MIKAERMRAEAVEILVQAANGLLCFSATFNKIVSLPRFEAAFCFLTGGVRERRPSM